MKSYGLFLGVAARMAYCNHCTHSTAITAHTALHTLIALHTKQGPADCKNQDVGNNLRINED